MNLQIYKPNAKNTGSAFNFSVDSRGDKPIFYVNAILQHSWNESNQTGNFSANKDDADKKLAIKLNQYELGEMLSSINSRQPWHGYHDFNDNKTSIAFTPWDKIRKIKDRNGQVVEHKIPAFGFTVSRNGNQTFRISLDPGEVEVLRQLIIKYLGLFLDSSANFSKSSPTPSVRNQNKNTSVDDDNPF